MKDHSLRSPANLLIQAEPREGQKQHQTQPGPANEGQSGDVSQQPGARAGVTTLPLTPSRLPTS